MITVEWPMVLPSVANMREHWAAKAKRVKSQRAAARAAFTRVHGFWPLLPGLGSRYRLAVSLTRISPRRIKDEHDNLRSAFKAVVDEVACQLGVDDSDHRLEWFYGQETGTPAIRVQFSVYQTSVGPTDGGARGASRRLKPSDAAAPGSLRPVAAVQSFREKP